MRGFFAAIAWYAMATAAVAADKPAIAPPGAWVRPAPLPPLDARPGEAAVRVLLVDQQVRLARDGDEGYYESVVRIQTPQGLASMGTITLPWRPDSMTLTVHKLHVLRGDKVIDVLAGGREFTVLRRENDLEHAVLDGMLTATIQPEGLQVGDVVDMAFTLKSFDPALRGTSQGGLGGLPAVPIDHVRMRAIWPGDLPVQWRGYGDLPPARESRHDGVVEIAFAADDVQPPVLPKGAPLRYAMTRTVQLTSLSGWPALSSLFAPLYVKASTLGPDSPLQAEIARIRAASPDPARRAELALALVQDEVRYVLLSMADGNLVPAGTDQTWSRRFGDCKGKTALLLALLHALDIEAEPGLISARLGDGLDERLPMVGLFDHVLVRATIGGKVYWLDGTRTGDRRLADIDVPPFRWALPVRAAKGATLERLEVQPPTKPFVATTLRIDAGKGVGAPAAAHVERRFRGDAGTAMRLAVANLTGDARERALKDYWRGEYAFLDPQKVDTRFDEASGEETLSVDGTATLSWAGRHYEADGSAIGYDADFSRNAGPNRDAPFAVAFPSYVVVREEIVLPNGGRGFEVRAHDIATTTGGVEYRRRGRIEKGMFVAETSVRSVAPEFPAKDAVVAQATIRGFKNEGLFVEMKADDRAAATGPAAARDFLVRGGSALARNDFAAAETEFQQARTLDPRSADAMSGLGFVRMAQGDPAGARTRFADALEIDPANQSARHGEAALAISEGRPADALALLDGVPTQGPRGWQILGLRGRALSALGRREEAVAVLGEAVRLQPANADLRLARAQALRSLGRAAEAAAEADALIAAAPQDSGALVIAGAIYAGTGRQAESERAFARSLAIKPSVTAYLTRVTYRPRADRAGRRADIDAALKLEPESVDGLRLLADEQARAGDYRGAIASLDRTIARFPNTDGLLLSRGIAHARLGDMAAARQDIAATRDRAPDQPMRLNNICWRLATEGVMLEDALALCDAALKITPADATILDSRGFVLLRLGRPADAIRAYDAALAARPRQAASLYGRGVARLRAGDRAGSAADIAAATAIDPHVVEEFGDYGITA